MDRHTKAQLLKLASDGVDQGYDGAVNFILAAIMPMPPQVIGSIMHENMVAAHKLFYERTNDKIQTIKMRRTLTGEGLKDAKEWVERFVLGY